MESVVGRIHDPVKYGLRTGSGRGVKGKWELDSPGFVF